MKIFLRILFLTIIFSGQAQNTIPVYNGFPFITEAVDGQNSNNYQIVTSSSGFDESATGTDLEWNLSLNSVGNAYVANLLPTASELVQFPGTTMVIVGSSTIGATTSQTKEYLKQNGSNTFFVTGYSDETLGLELNFLTDNGEIGTFPMTWPNDATADAVSGTYIYDTYAGTFSGTITTSTDAAGTISNGDAYWTSDVTRLKIVENFNFNYIPFGNVGTFIQTKNYYYKEYEAFPYFKSITTTVSIPLLGINETSAILYEGDSVFLNAPQFKTTSVVIAPNPVGNALNIVSKDFLTGIVQIIDLNGRIILEKNFDGNTFDVSSIKAGTYIIRLTNDNGVINAKFVKS